MEAIVLAAGLGTRLRPLTDQLPKALVPVAGVPMLERVLRRLAAAGATRVVINTHHHADMIETFVRERDGFGVDIHFSRETGDAPLETGGGVQQAVRFLSLEKPFLVHNVDVVTDLPLRHLFEAHRPPDLATLAVTDAETRSPLLVDDQGVFGVRFPSGTERRAREPVGTVLERAFCGVSVLSQAFPSLVTETGAFSIIPVYLRLITAGHRVATWEARDAFWTDIGTHESLRQANDLLAGT